VIFQITTCDGRLPIGSSNAVPGYEGITTIATEGFVGEGVSTRKIGARLFSLNIQVLFEDPAASDCSDAVAIGPISWIGSVFFAFGPKERNTKNEKAQNVSLVEENTRKLASREFVWWHSTSATRFRLRGYLQIGGQL
jgi:hypothetical protein